MPKYVLVASVYFHCTSDPFQGSKLTISWEVRTQGGSKAPWSQYTHGRSNIYILKMTCPSRFQTRVPRIKRGWTWRKQTVQVRTTSIWERPVLYLTHVFVLVLCVAASTSPHLLAYLLISIHIHCPPFTGIIPVLHLYYCEGNLCVIWGACIALWYSVRLLT